ncbi:MAG: hypothetical protein AB7K04_10945 [Pseudorhodoplanes sp.]
MKPGAFAGFFIAFFLKSRAARKNHVAANMEWIGRKAPVRGMTILASNEIIAAKTTLTFCSGN